jgi:type IV pilus assembly protein PilN
MIRINLLPAPKARKQERLLIEGFIAALSIAGVIAGCIILSGTKERVIDDLEAHNQKIQVQINELKARVGEVEKFKQKQKTLTDQIKVIKDLEARRSGPVRMMDELTDLVPRKMWIESFKENNGKLSVQGTAQDGPIIADFLEAIKRSKHFLNAVLQNVQSQEVSGQTLHRFNINLDVKYE